METCGKKMIRQDRHEETLSSYVENMLDAFGMYSAVRDETGNIVDFRVEYVNAAACELNRMTRDQQEGHLLCEILPAHKETGLFDEYRNLVETGGTLRKKSLVDEDDDGTDRRIKRVFDISASPYGDGFTASWRDVTEELADRVNFENNRQQTLDLVRFSAEGIVVLDSEGMVLFANPAAEGFLGKKAGGAAVGHHLGYPAADGETVVITCKKGNSDPAIVEMHAAEISWEGSPAFVVNLHDVTASRHAEQKLRLNEEKYRILFETMSQGVLYRNADGDITALNPAAERILGLTLEQMQDLISRDSRRHWIHEDGSDFPAEDHPSMAALKTGSQVRNVVMGIFHPADSTYRWININAVPQFRSNEDRPFQVYAIFEDITSRKIAFDQAQRLASIIQSTEDAVISKSLEGEITSWNPGARKMYGYSAEEAIGKNISLLIPDENQKEHAAVIEKIKLGQAVDAYETVRFRKNGERIYVSLTVSPIVDEGGKIIGASAIARNVTRQRKALIEIEKKTEELKESLVTAKKRESETKAILNGAQAALKSQSFESAARSIFDACCTATGAVSGYVALLSADGAENEVLFLESGGLPCNVKPDLPMPVRGLRAEAYSQAKVVSENDFMNCHWVEFMPAGHVHLNNVLFAPLTINEKVVGVMGLANKPDDFTDDDIKLAGAFGNLAAIALQHSQSEELLRESEKKYRFIADTTLDCIWMLDVDLTVRYVNPAVENIFGYTPEEYVGASITEYCDEAHLNDIFAALEEGLSKEPSKGVNFETSLKHRDGYNVPLEVIGRIIRDEEGKPVSIQGTARDITLRKQAEEEKMRLEQQLQQSQKLESIGQLAGGVAHDFNNMLSVILGYGEDIVAQLHDSDPLRDSAKEIVQAGKRSAALTRQLLAFSRKQTLQPEVLDLNYLIGNLEKMLRRLIGEDIELTTMLAEELSSVEVDPGQIEQVIMNIAVNSRDAMPNGGKLIIETANIELDDEYVSDHVGVLPGTYVLLTISDTGCGMDAATSKKVFDPFFTTKESGKGTGLGLSTVYGIVKQSKGNIWVYSETGRGSTFKIYLPATFALKDTKEAQKQLSRAHGNHEKILVVEDEPALRKLCGMALKNLDYEVHLAANAGEALLLVEENKMCPDLVLTDVVMPEISGKTLADRLRRVLPDLKVLYMSGYTDSVIAHNGLLDSGTPFIQKPFNIGDLSKKVQELLHR